VAKQKDAKWQLAEAGKRDTVVKQRGAKCLVMGNSMLSNVGAERADMMVECFSGIRAEQL
jgi:hypothetical protein